MKNRKNMIGFLLVCLLWACSKSDDNPIASPQVSYVQDISATFFTEGQSEAPQVDWNGDVGKFELQQTTKKAFL